MAASKIPGVDDPIRKPSELNDEVLPRVVIAPPGSILRRNATPLGAVLMISEEPLLASTGTSREHSGKRRIHPKQVHMQELHEPEIEALNLSEVAKRAAYALKKAHPSVKFTSGLRDRGDQARAMASNVAINRNWIQDTYSPCTARDKCQGWVNKNKDKKTAQEIAVGLKVVMDRLTDRQLSDLSRHLSGNAFDVRPEKKDAEVIKNTLRGLTAAAKKEGNKHAKFLEKEGGLVRWHAQF